MPELPQCVLEVGEGFWNIRGSFRIGLLEIGTQASLVRRPGGGYLLLDACGFDDATRVWLGAQTEGGTRLDAMLHLHPFHTIHVAAAHAAFPEAKLYGTVRHPTTCTGLPWQGLHTEDPALHAAFADTLTFSVPRGVDFVPANPRLHFASVLAFHAPSRTLHVDDTLLYMRMPWPVRWVRRDVFRFHPTLPKVLQRRPGAAAEFRAWAEDLVVRCRDVDHLCAAHTRALLVRDDHGAPIADRVAAALRGVEPQLAGHARDHER